MRDAAGARFNPPRRQRGSAVARIDLARGRLARERAPVIVSMGMSPAGRLLPPRRLIRSSPSRRPDGSDGVLGKLVVADLLKKIGVPTDSADRRQCGDVQPDADFSARTAAWRRSSTRPIRVKDHVATGRQMTQEKVEAVATGVGGRGRHRPLPRGRARRLCRGPPAVQVSCETAAGSALHADSLPARGGPGRAPLQPTLRQGPRRRGRQRQLGVDRTLAEGGATPPPTPRSDPRHSRRPDHAAARAGKIADGRANSREPGR